MAQIKTYKRWSNKLVISLVFVIFAFIVAFALMLIPSLGALAMTYALGFAVATMDFGLALFSAWQTWFSVISIGIFWFTVHYRKQLFPQKILVIPTATSGLQGGLMQTNPFATAPATTVIVPERKDEVVTSA